MERGLAWVGATTLVAAAGYLLKAVVSGYHPTDYTPSKENPLAVVVTGSTRGIGLELCRKFLSLQDSVVVNGRSSAAVAEAMTILKKEFPECKISGFAADVTNEAQMKDLVAHAEKALGKIDVFIANAGITQEKLGPLAEIDESEMKNIISTNVFGTLHSYRAAMACLTKQESRGHIFFMEGAGSNGMATANFSTYGE